MRHMGDVLATIGAIVASASQLAQLITPILTFLIAAMTLAWWIVRFAEKLRANKTGEPL